MNNLELYALLAEEIVLAPQHETMVLVNEMEALLARMSTAEVDLVRGITRF